MNQKEGMTLIELMIVIAITGILSSLAVPSFFSMLNSYRFAKAASDLEGFIQRAKLKSIKEKSSYSVCFDKSKNGYFEKSAGVGESASSPFIPFASYHAGIFIVKSKNIIFTRNGLIRGTGKVELKAASGVLKHLSFCMAGGVTLETEYD